MREWAHTSMVSLRLSLPLLIHAVSYKSIRRSIVTSFSPDLHHTLTIVRYLDSHIVSYLVCHGFEAGK